MTFAKRKSFAVWITWLVLSCAHPGKVSTEWDDAFPLREPPAGYQSPPEGLRLFFETINKDNLLSKAKQNRLSPEDRRFLNAAAFLMQEQLGLESQLKRKREIEILPSRSYSFALVSCCVNSGKERPIAGDGFRLGPLRGAPAEWLPQILDEYFDKQIPQERIQILIWALLSDSRFDELTPSQQTDLLELYPNARTRFGNRRLETAAGNLLDDLLPDEIRDLQSRFENYRSILRDASRTYEEVSELLAPTPSRTRTTELGWVKVDAGYLARVRSMSGYSSVRLEIYMPPGVDPLLLPSRYIALPGSGQRLAITANPVSTWGTQYREITDWLTNFWARRELSKTEQDLIRKYPLDAYKVYSNSRTTSESTRKHFPQFRMPHNNPADAFRHFVWAGLNAKDLGTSRAREFLEAHEDQPNQPKNESEIDRWNNEKGIEAAERLGPQATLADFERAGLDALRNNNLRTWR